MVDRYKSLVDSQIQSEEMSMNRKGISKNYNR